MTRPRSEDVNFPLTNQAVYRGPNLQNTLVNRAFCWRDFNSICCSTTDSFVDLLKTQGTQMRTQASTSLTKRQRDRDGDRDRDKERERLTETETETETETKTATATARATATATDTDTDTLH